MMKPRPLVHDELLDAQRKFNLMLADPASQDRVNTVIALQESIEECEGVDLKFGIEGGIPYKHWCDSCKKKYSRTYTLIDRWCIHAVINIQREAENLLNRGKDGGNSSDPPSYF